MCLALCLPNEEKARGVACHRPPSCRWYVAMVLSYLGVDNNLPSGGVPTACDQNRKQCFRHLQKEIATKYDWSMRQGLYLVVTVPAIDYLSSCKVCTNTPWADNLHATLITLSIKCRSFVQLLNKYIVVATCIMWPGCMHPSSRLQPNRSCMVLCGGLFLIAVERGSCLFCVFDWPTAIHRKSRILRTQKKISRIPIPSASHVRNTRSMQHHSRR